MAGACNVGNYIGMIFDHPPNDEEDRPHSVQCQLVENEPGTPVKIEWHFIRHSVASFKIKANKEPSSFVCVTHACILQARTAACGR